MCYQTGAIMKQLSLEQTADYLEASDIEISINAGFAIVHIGKNAAGADFALINDAMGETVVAEAL
jgi:hypothetical protein